ncbi:Exocyst complex component exo84b [Ancistrocladus abbreviatus]
MIAETEREYRQPAERKGKPANKILEREKKERDQKNGVAGSPEREQVLRSLDFGLAVMASAKTTLRSRATAGVASVKENGAKLEENLNLFKTDKFDAESYVQSKCSLNEKEIRHLCSYLVDLKKASAEEMRRSVYANYTAFIRTSKEISDLEGELLSIRNLLSTQAALIHGLAEGVHLDSLSASGAQRYIANGLSSSEDREPSELEKWLVDFPDLLDVLLAERRVDEALTAFDEGEHVISEAKEMETLSLDALMSLQSAISERKQKLADQLAEAACQPSTRSSELRAAISSVKRLGDGPRAHTLLLNAHLQRYQYNMQSLRPSSSSYGGAYTAALSQLVFSAIAQAASDSLTIFGKEPAYMSELVIWATQQTEAFAELVKRHALASSAAAGGLRAAAECVQIALGHCLQLEARGLSLCPLLVKHFRPSVEKAVDANLKRIAESTAALAAADDWVLTYPPTITRQSGRLTSLGAISAYNYKLTSSAHRFNLMVQDLFDDVGPLLSMQLGSKTLEGVYQVFNSYVSMLIKALPNSIDEETNFDGTGSKIVRIAENEAQQIALLANASLLAEELLPRAAMKLSPYNQGDHNDDSRRRAVDRQNRNPEQREWRRRLVSSVDRLKNNFCQQHALDLIFTEDGDSHLTAAMYINMDGTVDEIEWFPSLIFQELFLKLNRISSIATDMFVGRERFATLLLMKLTETVILWLSQDQSFWDDIEEGPKTLGSLGLQQFYLDMRFVILCASQGRYLSRNLARVFNEIISKAMTAFASTGMDPDSVLPEDSWFDEVCQEAIERLSGRPRLVNGDRDPNSPTASVSAQSVSSIRSHGSS